MEIESSAALDRSCTHTPDADTAQPRLQSVRMYGRAGTDEENKAILVGAYTYGTATAGAKLRYQRVPSFGFHAGISGTFGYTGNAVTEMQAFGNAYPTTEMLIDITGDGRPDVVRFLQSGNLTMARNAVSDGRIVLDDQKALWDAVLSPRTIETRTITGGRYDPNIANSDLTWRQLIDVNGDGRVDLVDATEEAGRWVKDEEAPVVRRPAESGWTARRGRSRRVSSDCNDRRFVSRRTAAFKSSHPAPGTWRAGGAWGDVTRRPELQSGYQPERATAGVRPGPPRSSRRSLPCPPTKPTWQ